MTPSGQLTDKYIYDAFMAHNQVQDGLAFLQPCE